MRCICPSIVYLDGALSVVGVGWKKAAINKTKTWHQFIKSLKIGLSNVNRCRLPG